jgi:hypothetical protein
MYCCIEIFFSSTALTFCHQTQVQTVKSLENIESDFFLIRLLICGNFVKFLHVAGQITFRKLSMFECGNQSKLTSLACKKGMVQAYLEQYPAHG